MACQDKQQIFIAQALSSITSRLIQFGIILCEFNTLNPVEFEYVTYFAVENMQSTTVLIFHCTTIDEEMQGLQKK